jgi:prevent-host-death family protein
MSVWQLQTAKAKLSEFLRAVREHGPQTISVRGKEEYVVSRKSDVTVANEDSPGTGLDLFRPVLGVGVELELPQRRLQEPREIWTPEDLQDET